MRAANPNTRAGGVRSEATLDATLNRDRVGASRQMVVPINGCNYTIVVVPGPLLVRGETAASRVRHDDRTIEVDDIIPAADRWRVAALAVAYACRNGAREKFVPVRVLGAVD